ncbi:class I SAM-dependent methyltransferase [Streptomyces sp. RKND-216]|uniref:class I SAM-dependent methyltransferase n=1 Tax=Streptomyces sp. RKND-216 TaxID=2562581 RepID=UPI00109DF553|nr:class I SAM-dependent methyltransferase [Streptomyces sp. RKND-216]THA25721.1 class I SAM-dependent methyltransferase [Streptomyces sp. RKND-216]
MVTTAGEAFLRGFHAERPAVTGEAFGHGRAADGRTGYEALRDRVAGCRRVLDLGCGDGVLLRLLAAGGDGRRAETVAGVDLSPEALALARLRPELARAVLVEGRAQQLPFAAGAFDACVSHMALMLMDDVERVAAEAARVLAPGGLFACVLGGGAAGGEAYEAFLRLLRPLLAAVPEERRMPPLGDRRVRSRDGLDAVLGPAGFGPVEWETLRIDLDGSPEEVWRSVSGIYDVRTLDGPALAGLRAAFLAEAAALALPGGGPVPCAFDVHLATAHLATARLATAAGRG